MKKHVFYEWSLEITDKNGDIIDIDFNEKLSDFSDLTAGSLCLVRRLGDEAGGECDRVWAYVKDGKLPEYFGDVMGNPVNTRVPKKYHNELHLNEKTD